MVWRRPHQLPRCLLSYSDRPSRRHPPSLPSEISGGATSTRGWMASRRLRFWAVKMNWRGRFFCQNEFSVLYQPCKTWSLTFSTSSYCRLPSPLCCSWYACKPSLVDMDDRPHWYVWNLFKRWTAFLENLLLRIFKIFNHCQSTPVYNFVHEHLQPASKTVPPLKRTSENSRYLPHSQTDAETEKSIKLQII